MTKDLYGNMMLVTGIISAIIWAFLIITPIIQLSYYFIQDISKSERKYFIWERFGEQDVACLMGAMMINALFVLLWPLLVLGLLVLGYIAALHGVRYIVRTKKAVEKIQADKKS